MRRKDKALPDEATADLLQRGEYGVMSTVDDKGQPYGVPLSYVFQNDCLYFHCALEGRKLDNLLSDSRVSFCVVGHTRVLPAKFSTEYESVIVIGKASVVQGGERNEALLGLVDKYSSEFAEEGRRYIEKLDKKTTVVKIEVVKMTGKANVGS